MSWKIKQVHLFTAFYSVSFYFHQYLSRIGLLFYPPENYRIILPQSPHCGEGRCVDTVLFVWMDVCLEVFLHFLTVCWIPTKLSLTHE